MLFNLLTLFDTVESPVGFPGHGVLNLILNNRGELVKDLDTYKKSQ